MDVTKSDHIPRWVAVGAFALSLIGGLINVVGLLGFEQQAITRSVRTLHGDELEISFGPNHFTGEDGTGAIGTGDPFIQPLEHRGRNEFHNAFTRQCH